MAVITLPARVRAWRQPSVLPGFGLTLGFTLAYLGLIVLIPIYFVALFAGFGIDRRFSGSPRSRIAGIDRERPRCEQRVRPRIGVFRLDIEA